MRRFDGSELVLASHNKGKLVEIAELIRPYGVTARSAAEFDLQEPEETETTFAGNARIKAHFAARATGLPALSDDSGLMVDALDGAPGVYTADWAETPNGRDFLLAMGKVHDKLQAAKAPQPWTARFCATLCIAWPDGHDEVFAGHVDGHLVWPIRGANGFGFDPMFQPLGETDTFGEMDPAKKHGMSHRAVAFAKLLKDCLER